MDDIETILPQIKLKDEIPGLVSLLTTNWDHYDADTGPFIHFVDQYTPDPKELVIVDQGSNEGDREKLVGDTRKFPWLKVVLLDKNTGFPRGNNIAMEEAEGEYIIWINNDVELMGDWLSPIIAELKANRRQIVGMSLVERGGWNEHIRDGVAFSMPYLEGWLMACHRSFVEEIGIFDEIFGIGSLEDLDLCWRAQLAGYTLMALPHLPFFHKRGQTVCDGRLQQYRISEENYAKVKERVVKGFYDRKED